MRLWRCVPAPSMAWLVGAASATVRWASPSLAGSQTRTGGATSGALASRTADAASPWVESSKPAARRTRSARSPHGPGPA